MATTTRSLTTLFPPYRSYLEQSTKLGPSSRRRYLYELEVFARHVENRPLDQLAPADLLEWHQMLVSAGAHARTIEQKHAAIKRFLRYLDEFLEDPAAQRLLRAMRRIQVNAPREPTREKWSLEPEQEQKMLEATAQHGDRGARDRAMLHFLLATGARISEVTGLDTSRLDLRERLADLLGKGSKWRTVAFSKACQDDMAAWLDQRASWIAALRQDDRLAGRLDDAAVFISVNGRRLTPGTFGALVKLIAKEAGIRKEFWTHLTRHTFITRRLRAGTPITQVSIWVGHQDPATTLGYVAESRESIRQEYDRALRREAAETLPSSGESEDLPRRRSPRRSRRGAA